MKKNLILAVLASSLLLAGCGAKSPDQVNAEAVAGKSGLIVSSATNKGLTPGEGKADLSANKLKSPAFLYVFVKWTLPGEDGNNIPATISWETDHNDAFKITTQDENSGRMKYALNAYPVSPEANLVVTFTGTVTVGSATATAHFEVTFLAKAAA